jgi:hypothetical protein
MATTTLGDIFARDRAATFDVLQSYMDTDPVTTTPFFESGILVSNPIVAEAAASATAQVAFPYFGRIDAGVEPNYSNDVYEDIAIPRKIDTDYLNARVAFLNEVWSSMDLVQEITGIDPLQRVASKLQLYWQEEAELRLLATLKGLYADSIAGANDMNVNVAAAGSVFDGVLDALATLGDAFGAIAGYVVDSRTYFRAVKEGMAEKDITRTNTISRGMIFGLPAIINDKAMRTGAGQSVITLMGTNAIAYGMANPKVPLAYEREEARGNGGGTEALWTRRNMIVHPMGYDFTSASITGNGTETTARSAGWTDLANPANWNRKASRKQVPIAFATVANPA